jgi:hypothetical protein
VETTQIHPYKVHFDLKINTFTTKPLVPPNTPLHLANLKWDTLSDFECDIIQCLALISYKRGNLLVAEATEAKDRISVQNPEATWSTLIHQTHLPSTKDLKECGFDSSPKSLPTKRLQPWW